MNINIGKLSKELVSAGITTHGNCNSNGVVWDDNNNEIQTRPDVAAIIANHNPGPSWDDVRAQRNLLMASCDWTQIPDAVLTFTERAAWQDYRQALRDIPQSFANPDLVVWPVSP